MSLIYFIITLLILILIHESGHFLVARWCGVQVLRFSFGFGKTLKVWRDKKGTEYAWSLLPLGGYVKLLDENEAPVPESQRQKTLNHQPLWARVAIVLAGPLFNFLFAFAMLWLVAVIGIKSFAPRIENVMPGSIAAQAQLGTGQEIIAIGDKKINHWRDVHYALMPLLGTRQDISITLKSLKDHSVITRYLSLKNWHLNGKHTDLLESLGMVPLFPKLPPVIDFVIPQSPASLAGLKVGDRILAVDQQPIDDWVKVIEQVKTHPGAALLITVQRDGKTYQVPVNLLHKAGKDKTLLGVGARTPEIPPDWLRWERSTPIEAIGQAFRQTVSLTSMTCVMIGRTIIGHLSLDHLSGPIGIAKAAGQSIHIGFVYYLFFIALLSISLGVLNLLPIPMLDGGHLLYYLIEFVIRRPLSVSFKTKGAMIGVGFIIIMTVIAFINDLKVN